MKVKTLRKEMRRFDALPLAHIDTSVLLESPKTTDGFYCKKFLNRLGNAYRGKLSLVALGELFLDILRITDYNERQDAFAFIQTIIEQKHIAYGYFPQTLLTVVHEIHIVDQRLAYADTLLLACAIADRAHYFVTLDHMFLRNEKLEKRFCIKIRHPKTLYV